MVASTLALGKEHVSDHLDKADLHRRLEELEERFAEVVNYFASSGSLPEHHRAKIDEFEERRDTIRARLAEGDLHKHPIDAGTKSEFEKDVENLMNAFERWVEHVDKEFTQAR